MSGSLPVKRRCTERLAGALALLAAACCATLQLSACSDVDKADRPTPLANKFVSRVAVRRVWSTHLAGEAPKLRLALGLAVSGQRVFAASHRGAVEAFDVTTGRRLWRPVSGVLWPNQPLIVVIVFSATR